jgi:hypothetical protein
MQKGRKDEAIVLPQTPCMEFPPSSYESSSGEEFLNYSKIHMHKHLCVQFSSIKYIHSVLQLSPLPISRIFLAAKTETL